MFFVLSKILWYVVNPFNVIVFLLVIGLLWSIKSRRAGIRDRNTAYFYNRAQRLCEAKLKIMKNDLGRNHHRLPEIVRMDLETTES
ncbi:MAG: hypothetical protein P9M13_04075 [Candidatus Ancaeobacter aquaticus]|nr:hypothetical protein [Candidatus Ancaeobacter aquaticus]